MKTKYLILLYLFFFVACGDNEEIVKFPVVENKYNPNLPLSADRIKPAYGGIDGTFVIEGNFKGDIFGMKVYFGDKRAVLIATDGQSIMGIVPKQPPGNNSVSVVVGHDSLAPSDLKFKYKQTRSIKTVAGNLGTDGYVDGDVNAARFSEPSHIATVKGQKGDNVIVIESWWVRRVRLVSLDDNKVITLVTGNSFGTPAVDNSREVFYSMGLWEGEHDIYSFSRADGWMPTMTGIKIAQSDANCYIHALQFFGEDEQYLYALSAQCHFFRIDLKNKSYERITLQGVLPTNFNNRSQFIYSKYHDCFFASFPNEQGVYKIYNTGGSRNPNKDSWWMERYAGFNGAGWTTGHRLNDAKFLEPQGLTVTSDGEIFVTNRGGHFINKISGDQVELVAGKPGSWGWINGDPLDARLDQPQDIAVDSEDNFFVAGGMDRSIRKLSIE